MLFVAADLKHIVVAEYRRVITASSDAALQIGLTRFDSACRLA
jgi:hypothetical protein